MAISTSPADTARGAGAGAIPLTYRVIERRRETADAVTLALAPVGPAIEPPRPGQFTMLYAFGNGEIPVSVSGIPDEEGLLLHTVRAVGAVSRALCALRVTDTVGVRGPFGTTWDLPAVRGRDLVVVAGGIGLAPLRSVAVDAVRHRERYGRVTVLVGARTPEELLFSGELREWAARADVETRITVDRGSPGWSGDVGVVTGEIERARIDGARAVAMVCGPEVMMRFAARALVARGVAEDRVLVSLERSMQCGNGQCGHCQLGPFFVCSDGPVFTWDVAASLLRVPEL